MRCQACGRPPLRFLFVVQIVVTGDRLTFCSGCCYDFLAVLAPEADIALTTVEP